MVVWLVVGVLGAGAVAAAYASRRHGDDVEPTVREFAEFRDAISRQVAGVDSDTRATRRHLDARTSPAGPNGGPVGERAGEPPSRG
jgi:hypothetical protein